METWTIKEWGILFSIVISLASFSFVLYKDLIQGSKLETVLNTIVFVRVPEENKHQILTEILIDDLLSGRPSDQAGVIINKIPELVNSIARRNRELTRNLLLNYLMGIKSSGGEKLLYDASPESVTRYFGHKSFALSFYCPLNIVNTGNKTGDITTLLLKISSISDPKSKWIFSTFTEIKPDEFMTIKPDQPLGTILGKLYPGISIAANDNHRLDAFLINMDSANGTIISSSSITPGKYNVQIVGYNSRNKKTLESNIGFLTITPKVLIDIFNGSNIVNNLSIENHIEQLLKE